MNTYYVPLDGTLDWLFSPYNWQVEEALVWLRYWWDDMSLLPPDDDKAVSRLSTLCMSGTTSRIRHQAASLLALIAREYRPAGVTGTCCHRQKANR